MIYFEDRGPVFYNAPRLGRNGKVFIMYKFRSMKVNSRISGNADGINVQR
ncbi:MAG: sugar transferase [Limnochordia bacterium]